MKLFTFIDFLLNLVCSDQFNNWSVVDLTSDKEDPGNDGKSSGGICILLCCISFSFEKLYCLGELFLTTLGPFLALPYNLMNCISLYFWVFSCVH